MDSGVTHPSIPTNVGLQAAGVNCVLSVWRIPSSPYTIVRRCAAGVPLSRPAVRKLGYLPRLSA